MSHEIPEIDIATTHKSFWSRLSIIWLVPLAALAIALGVAWHNYTSRGPLITVYFENAAGVRAKETALRYRDVTVGLVEKVRFTETLDQVALDIRLDPSVAEYVDESAQFWVVSPEVTTQGVTGLETVLSGVYVQGLWDNQIGAPQDTFEGAKSAPLLAAGEEGLRISLLAMDRSLNGNSPILYKGVEVGRVGPAEVSPDGFTVEAEAVIYAPYDTLVTESTRFWNTSGFSLSFGPGGASLDFESLSSLIAGGVTFDTFVSGGSLAQDDDSFELYRDNGAARASLFSRADGPALSLVAVFEGDVTGLTVGAPIELDGLRVGEVSGINGYIDAEAGGELKLQAILNIRPSRLGLEGDDSTLTAMEYLAREVREKGLRARLVTGSLLTGGLKVQLVEDPDAPTLEIDLDALPYPHLPTTASDITNVAATAQGTLDRISALPVEELLQGAIDFLNNATVLIGKPETQAIPDDIRALLGDARNVTASPEIQELPQRVAEALGGIEAAAAELQAILERFTQEDGVGLVLQTFTSVDTAAGQVSEAIVDVPQLVTDIQDVAGKFQELDVETLLGSLNSAVGSADSVLSDPRTRQLPADISLALASLAATLDEVREGGVVENANATLQSARNAADQLASAANSLPNVVDRVNALLAQATSAVSNFDDTSNVMRDARSAIREVADAANAVAALARAIERRPNSLLLGR